MFIIQLPSTLIINGIMNANISRTISTPDINIHIGLKRLNPKIVRGIIKIILSDGNLLTTRTSEHPRVRAQILTELETVIVVNLKKVITASRQRRKQFDLRILGKTTLGENESNTIIGRFARNNDTIPSTIFERERSGDSLTHRDRSGLDAGRHFQIDLK